MSETRHKISARAWGKSGRYYWIAENAQGHEITRSPANFNSMDSARKAGRRVIKDPLEIENYMGRIHKAEENEKLAIEQLAKQAGKFTYGLLVGGSIGVAISLLIQSLAIKYDFGIIRLF